MSRVISSGVLMTLLSWLLSFSAAVSAEAPTDEELKALEQQIEQQEAEQAEARRKAAEEIKRKAEEEAKRKAEEEAKKQAEEAKKPELEKQHSAEEEARRQAEEEKRRVQIEQQQREKFSQYLQDADAAMNKKEYSRALQAYAQALEIFPDDAAALAGQARARESREICAALVGEWDWILGSTTIISADGNLQGISLLPNHGSWECTDPAQRKFILRWVVGGWVDTAILSADGNTVDVTNNVGVRFQGQRKGSRKNTPAQTNPVYGR